MSLADLNSAKTAAISLLGWTLSYDSPNGQVAGRIGETEAYVMDDPASHAYGGRRPRNDAMFGPAGTVYIYFIYGVHYCLNVVTGPAGDGQAVLLRALEPLNGLEIMRRNRAVDTHGKLRQAQPNTADINLTNGPAKLVQALGIPASLNGTRFNDGPLHLIAGEPIEPGHVVRSTRIGISRATDTIARFYINGNKFVSRA